MKNQFMTRWFWIEIIIAFAIAVVIYFAAKHYNRNMQPKDIKVDYFRIPTNTALVVLSLLVPILVALASYLYINNPNDRYSSLLSTIVLMFFVLIIAIWETFALLKKAQNADIINIVMPNDLKYIVGMGWMYGFLLVGLIYFSIFFLFEIAPNNKVQKQETASGSGTHHLLKPNVKINQSKDEIMKLWGQPVSEDPSYRTLKYESEHSILQLYFDGSQKLKKIIEERR